MHIIKILLSIFLGLFCSFAYPQKIKLGFQSGIGTYEMNELKWVTSSVYDGLPFQAKIISNYPPFLYYKPSFLLSFSKFSIGLQLSKYSTGSRISSKDYSGEYLFNTKIKGIAPSIYFDFGHFPVLKKIRLSPFIETGIIYSKLELKEFFYIYDTEITNETYNFTSKNYYVESGLKTEYGIYKFISVELNSSYAVQFGKKNLETKEGMTISGNRGAARPNWSGFRFGISFVITYP